jgi:hypothetical protein
LIQYDQEVLRAYAQWLYNRASWILLAYLLAGMALGAALGYLPTILWYLRSANDTRAPSSILVVPGIILFGGVFAWLGHAKGFAYRVKAQIVLCQVQIEINTRRES